MNSVTAVAVVLTLAYVGVAALLLNLNLATRRRAAVKTFAIVLVTALYVGAWHGHRSLLGWASDDPLPERFRLHWATVDDPDKRTHTPGTIYLWIRALDPADRPRGEPRAYRITWDAATAKAVLDALAEVERGVDVNGTTWRPVETGLVEPKAGDLPEGLAPVGIAFRAAPSPPLPPKR